MTTATNHPTPELLSESALGEIEAAQVKRRESLVFHQSEYPGLPSPSYIEEIDALCATLRAAWAERDRALTPSIVEALRLLDDAGYGKEVPNSLSEMIKRVLTANTALRNQLAQADETNRLAGLQIVELEFRLAQVEKERAEQRSMEITAGNWGREED